jgi:hypothetical protein
MGCLLNIEQICVRFVGVDLLMNPSLGRLLVIVQNASLPTKGGIDGWNFIYQF